MAREDRIARGTPQKMGGAGRALAVFVFAGGGLLAMSGQSWAQRVPAEIDAALENCNRLEDPQERLTCLRAIFETEQSGRDRQTDEDARPRGEDASPVASENGMVPGGIDERARLDDAVSERGASERAAPRATDDDFGLPPKIEKGARKPALSSNVIRYHELGKIGHPVFVLENGQVWQETDGEERVKLPSDPPFRITIRKGMFGDFQMKVDGRAGFMRVKRLK